MTRKQLRESVERYLQGKRNERWSDSEINSYLDESQLEFCRLAKVPEVEASIVLLYGVTDIQGIAGVLSASGRTVSVVDASHGLSVDGSVLIT